MDESLNLFSVHLEKLFSVLMRVCALPSLFPLIARALSTFMSTGTEDFTGDKVACVE